MTQLPFTDQKPLFMQMEEKMSYSQMDPEQQRIYMDSLNRYRTAVAVRKYEHDRGFAVGFAEGFAEEYAKRFTKSRAEIMVEIARHLIAENISVGIITDVTGLTKEVIESLQMQSKNTSSVIVDKN